MSRHAALAWGLLASSSAMSSSSSVSPLPPSASVLFARLTNRARLRQLHLLVRIGEAGHLQKAAQSIGMSQPAATHALGEIESLLGVSLFERHARGMRATAIGLALLPLIQKSLASLLDGAQLLASRGAGMTQALRVGSIGSGITGLLQRMLPDFNREHRHVSIDVLQMQPDELLLACLQGAIDIGIRRRPNETPPGFQFQDLLQDRYAVVCAPTHRLAACPQVPLEELAAHSWLMPPTGTHSDRDFTKLWESFGRVPDLRWVTAHSPMVLLAMLRDGSLLSFMPHSHVRQWLEAGVLCEIAGQWGGPLPTLGALYRADMFSSNDLLRAFVGALGSAARPTSDVTA